MRQVNAISVKIYWINFVEELNCVDNLTEELFLFNDLKRTVVNVIGWLRRKDGDVKSLIV